MNICMLLAGRDFPPDIRVEKEARTLRSAGHRVTVVCEGRGDRPTEDSWDECGIRRVPVLRGVAHKVEQAFWLAMFRHRRWARVLDRLAAEERIDALHVHDLPMLGTALAAGRRYEIPVVADLHENHPAALAYYRSGSSGGRWPDPAAVFFRPDRWESYERRAAAAADHVLVVVEEARERLEAAGVPADRISVVENTEDIDAFGSIPLDPEVLGAYPDEFVIAYIGGFGGRHRGLAAAVEAMPAILRGIPNARLLLVGHGPIEPELRRLARARSVEDRLTVVGWQPFRRVPSFIAASAVCLVPHEKNAHTEATSPHKLFQYMLMGRPVVVSSCRPLRRVVEETGAGVVFEAGNPAELARAVLSLADPERRSRFGEAGRRAVLERYNWAATSGKLLEVYDHLARR